jgi:hypothetical protein
MPKIFKYIGPKPDSPSKFTLNLPQNFEILKIGMQEGKISLWAAIDPVEKKEGFVFHITSTGLDVPESETVHSFIQYVDTIFDGEWVWHIFVEKEI